MGRLSLGGHCKKANARALYRCFAKAGKKEPVQRPRCGQVPLHAVAGEISNENNDGRRYPDIRRAVIVTGCDITAIGDHSYTIGDADLPP